MVWYFGKLSCDLRRSEMTDTPEFAYSIEYRVDPVPCISCMPCPAIATFLVPGKVRDGYHWDKKPFYISIEPPRLLVMLRHFWLVCILYSIQRPFINKPNNTHIIKIARSYNIQLNDLRLIIFIMLAYSRGNCLLSSVLSPKHFACSMCIELFHQYNFVYVTHMYLCISYLRSNSL